MTLQSTILIMWLMSSNFKKPLLKTFEPKIFFSRLRLKRGDVGSMELNVYHCISSQEKPITTSKFYITVMYSEISKIQLFSRWMVWRKSYSVSRCSHLQNDPVTDAVQHQLLLQLQIVDCCFTLLYGFSVRPWFEICW